MSGFLGRNIRLKVEEPHDSGTYKFIGGLQSASYSISNERKTVGDLIGQSYTEIINGTGPTSYSISGNGIFKNSLGERIAQESMNARTVRRFMIVFGNGDMLTGLFVVNTFDRSGGFNDAESYSMTLDSSGEVSLVTQGSWNIIDANWETIDENWEDIF